MFLFTLYKNKKCAEKRKLRTSRAVLDAVLNSDDDSDETDFPILLIGKYTVSQKNKTQNSCP